MIPESRRLIWNDDGYPLDSDEEADARIRRHLHKSWARRKELKKAESEVFSHFKKEGLTYIQAYVAIHKK
jgi:hypothetical protein